MDYLAVFLNKIAYFSLFDLQKATKSPKITKKGV